MIELGDPCSIPSKAEEFYLLIKQIKCYAEDDVLLAESEDKHERLLYKFQLMGQWFNLVKFPIKETIAN